MEYGKSPLDSCLAGTTRAATPYHQGWRSARKCHEAATRAAPTPTEEAEPMIGATVAGRAGAQMKNRKWQMINPSGFLPPQGMTCASRAISSRGATVRARAPVSGGPLHFAGMTSCHTCESRCPARLKTLDSCFRRNDTCFTSHFIARCNCSGKSSGFRGPIPLHHQWAALSSEFQVGPSAC